MVHMTINQKKAQSKIKHNLQEHNDYSYHQTVNRAISGDI